MCREREILVVLGGGGAGRESARVERAYDDVRTSLLAILSSIHARAHAKGRL